MTRWASRITTGSAQAPPIQPCTSPSAVMIAREPGWLEDGLWRQTTVASTNGCPRRVSSPISSRRAMPSTMRSALVVRPHRWRAGHIAAVRQGLPDPVREQRHVNVADPGVRQRVHDRVDVSGRAAHGGALADALGADRVVRAGRDDLAVQLEARRL